jgi:hypothetical protein
MQEAGVHGFEVDPWHAMFVLAKTPKPTIDELPKWAKPAKEANLRAD